MRFKTLKHKTLEGIFGSVDRGLEEDFPFSEKGHLQILHSSIPILQPITATMENMVKYWIKYEEEHLIEQLEDYDLVVVDIKIII